MTNKGVEHFNDIKFDQFNNENNIENNIKYLVIIGKGHKTNFLILLQPSLLL